MRVAFFTIYIKNYFLNHKNLLEGFILICTNHFILAYFKSQIILFLLVKYGFLNAQSGKPVKKEVKPN